MGEAASALATVARELEADASAAGWDAPARLFALVPTADLLTREPQLAVQLGLDPSGPLPELISVEQELPADRELEEVLSGIGWPEAVAGAAVIAERLVLPPGIDGEVPEDPQAAQEFAAAHPDRQEVRIVAAVVRGGESACALRLRSHDADDMVLTGPDLVPGLVGLVRSTLDSEETPGHE